MFAIRCLRFASGVDIAGIRYPHQGWIVQEDLTPELTAKSTQLDVNPATGAPHTFPLLQIVEPLSFADDILQGFPVVNAPDFNNPEFTASAGLDTKPSDLDGNGVIDDLEAKTKAELIDMAKAAGISATPAMNKAALIDAIRSAKPTEPEKPAATEPTGTSSDAQPATE